MLQRCSPISNTERQRRFRATHPGYNRKYNGRPSKAQRLRIKQMLVEAHAKAEAHVQLVLRSTICKPLPLMLPAPGLSQVLIISGMNTIEMPRATRAAEFVPLARAA